ncbi:MAG: helix-hairpin-helix domain-containing protein [Thermodesulfobacteriota bacterium]
MRISKLMIQKLKSFLNLQSTIRTPHSLKYFSLSQQWVLFALAFFVLGLLYLRFYHHPSPVPQAIIREFVVEVSGEIQNPGVYLFQNQPTLGEAIERAGGLKETVRMDIPQTSEILETGTLLTVSRGSPRSPPQGEKEEDLMKEKHGGNKNDKIKIKIGRMAANELLVFSIPLDLNQVSMEDLCLIPGIGTSLAQEIIAYREKRRAFRSVEELKKVKGIGEKKWKAIKNFFIVTQPFRVDPSRP